QMIEERASDVAPVQPRRREVALEMSRRETVDQIGKTVQRKQPRKKEVPAASFGERLIAGNRDPPGKGTAREESIPVAEDTEHAGGVETRAAELDPADRRTIHLLFGVDRKRGRIGIAPRNAP